MDKVRVAMVGCGGFQRYRVGNLEKVRDAKIVALVDTSDEQIALMKEQRPVTADAATYNDLTTMLAEVKPDAIMIATPHTQHVDQILEGLSAGCHVCCEIPGRPTTPAARPPSLSARPAALRPLPCSASTPGAVTRILPRSAARRC